TTRNTSLATLKTIAFVQIIPSFAISFLASMLGILIMVRGLFTGGVNMASQTAAARMTVWFPLLTAVVTALLSGGKDFRFFTLARRRLYFGFRDQASRVERVFRSERPRWVAPSTIPPIAPPPVILSGS